MIEHLVVYGGNAPTFNWLVIRLATTTNHSVVATANNQAEAIRIRDGLNLVMNPSV